MNQITRGTTTRSICQKCQLCSITFLAQSFLQTPHYHRIKADFLILALSFSFMCPRDFLSIWVLLCSPSLSSLTICQAGWVYFWSAFSLITLLHLPFYLSKVDVSSETKWNPYLPMSSSGLCYSVATGFSVTQFLPDSNTTFSPAHSLCSVFWARPRVLAGLRQMRYLGGSI